MPLATAASQGNPRVEAVFSLLLTKVEAARVCGLHLLPAAMKVVGLLSGGKDSCYNLCHCVAQGHEIVALATLAPPEGKGASRRAACAC